MHGSIIGNKLKARAQKKSGVTKKLDASKPVVTAAAKSESKMDALKEKKMALETKNKGVAEADKTPGCGRNETNHRRDGCRS
jgi:folylpolyglutamate synthase/dihydropteroate synthase